MPLHPLGTSRGTPPVHSFYPAPHTRAGSLPAWGVTEIVRQGQSQACPGRRPVAMHASLGCREAPASLPSRFLRLRASGPSQMCRNTKSCVAIHFFSNFDPEGAWPEMRAEDKQAPWLGCPCQRGRVITRPSWGTQGPCHHEGCCGPQGEGQALALRSGW